MPLLPLRALPVNGSHEGPLTIRVEPRSTGSLHVYVRRESDKKTWVCKVRSLQEILAPTLRVRPLDMASVVMCLYNGVAFDSSSSSAYETAPLELRRREVAFTQPETWTDGDYRLSMRVAVRNGAIIAVLTFPLADVNGNTNDDTTTTVQALPVTQALAADDEDENVVFGLHFTPTTKSLDHCDPANGIRSSRNARLHLLEPAFSNAYLNWSSSSDRNVVRTVENGIQVVSDGMRCYPLMHLVVTLDILHARTPVLFTVAVDSIAIKAVNATTYQTHPGGDLHHTITQYIVTTAARSMLHVVMLPGSVCALEGTAITFREQVISNN